MLHQILHLTRTLNQRPCAVSRQCSQRDRNSTEKNSSLKKFFNISALKNFSHNNLRKWATSKKTENQYLPKTLGNRRWSLTFVTVTKTKFCTTILQEIFRQNGAEKFKENLATEFNGVTNFVVRSQFVDLKTSPRHTFNWVPNILNIGF